MNFFERQQQARRQSGRLVILFAMAVAAIVIAVNLVYLVAVGGFPEDGSPRNVLGGMLVVSVVTVGIIAVASMHRISSLSSGGAAVARQMGGTPVPEDTTDLHYRRLRNVVEEIAIASGVPVPQLFVLEDEAGINAFAAGYAPGDAAVAVTRGALDKLNRDELQGVIAHEFSHVLNGDMRLNIRLMGLLFGILALAIVARKVLLHGRGNSRGGLPVILVALAVLVVGYAGQFFGRLIKAGISRQREFLADASAVQFTRQTTGLAGALKKIAGLPDGSRLASRDTEEVAHMLFGDGVGYSSLFATHPPLLARIQALEPSFRAEALEDQSARWQMHPPSGLDEDVALGLDARTPPPLPGDRAELQVTPPAVVAQVGAPQANDYARAGALVKAIPEVLRHAARERDEAPAMLFGLLMAPPGKVRERQQFELSSRLDERLVRQTLDYADRLAELPRILCLPLAAMAMPSLRRRPRAELELFMDTCYVLTHADGQVSVFEYCLGRLLGGHVKHLLDPAANSRPANRRLADQSAAAIEVMAVLAQAGHDDPAAAMRAYLAGIARVFPRLNAPYRPPAEPLRALDAALPKLDDVEPVGKELLLEGLVAAVSHDGRICVAEAELLRAVSATLRCPLPPMLEA
ncbi:MAG TPA: M48 family metallopeptidase [Arenimonas sp.]|uniref:M48 family metallopeptidase n=1 Tax=Arenimonas sp. TaxID=1872635 RepID=UPI002D7F703A|nr:M48 family metallopeptidase [Arenimonas sp.]HEU0154213.1 M48 family metallopeptidase [Arenimonas sp.]